MNLELVKALTSAVMAIVLLGLMTWIVLSPHTSEERLNVVKVYQRCPTLNR